MERQPRNNYREGVFAKILYDLFLKEAIENKLKEKSLPFLEATVRRRNFKNLKTLFGGTIEITREKESREIIKFKWTPEHSWLFLLCKIEGHNPAAHYLLRKPDGTEAFITVLGSSAIFVQDASGSEEQRPEFLDEKTFLNEWKKTLRGIPSDEFGEVYHIVFQDRLLKNALLKYEDWANNYATTLQEKSRLSRERGELKENEFYGLNIFLELPLGGAGRIIHRESNKEAAAVHDPMLVIGYRITKDRGYDYRLDSH